MIVKKFVLKWVSKKKLGSRRSNKTGAKLIAQIDC